MTSRHSPSDGAMVIWNYGDRLFRLQAEDPERESSADGLGAVLNVQLAQDLLDVVLHRERADPENRADLDVALAEVNPAKDLLLPGSEQGRRPRRRAGAFRRGTAHLGSNPCQVQERH